MWIRLKIFLSIFFILFLSWKAESQNLVYSFIDPCTKTVTNFNIPIQGGTTIFFLGQQRAFTANDISSGVFGAWINQAYSDYRKISPCSVQSTTVIRNQITSQIIGSTVSSVVGSIMGQAQSIASGNLVNDDGGKDNSGGGKSKSDKKQKKNETNNSNNGSSTSDGSNTGNTTNGGTNQQSTISNNGGSQGTNTENSNSNTGNGGTVGGGNSSNPTTTSSQSKGSSEKKDNEVVGSITMNVDSKQENGSSKGKSGGRSNPVIVSSDLTSAQNLDRSFTGIINVGMSQSSLTGTSSWGVTSMIWFNLKQFAISGRYSKIQFSKNGKLKLIHNLNLTGVYSYGNYLGFLGYSAILNAGKWGVTGVNVSAAATKIPEDGNLFISPSVTAFYTKPFKANTRLIISPEIYIISTPLIYSSVDKVTVTDRTFSAFLGSGFDYQLSKRFKFNFNYKLNMSTNPDFPILSFFLIGSKVNL
jgi:hypothetical protein